MVSVCLFGFFFCVYEMLTVYQRKVVTTVLNSSCVDILDKQDRAAGAFAKGISDIQPRTRHTLCLKCSRGLCGRGAEMTRRADQLAELATGGALARRHGPHHRPGHRCLCDRHRLLPPCHQLVRPLVRVGQVSRSQTMYPSATNLQRRESIWNLTGNSSPAARNSSWPARFAYWHTPSDAADVSPCQLPLGPKKTVWAWQCFFQDDAGSSGCKAYLALDMVACTWKA